MKNKVYTIIVIMFAIVALTACGKQASNNNIAQDNINESNTYFELSSDVIRDRDVASYLNDYYTQQHIDEAHEKEKTLYNDTAGELTISNSNGTALYGTDGNNIVFDGVVYENLNYIVDSIEHPYSKEDLINFIVETYKPKNDIVHVQLVDDNVGMSDGGTADNEVIYVTVDSQIRDFNNPRYDSICKKYNDVATWMVMLYEDGMSNRACIAGSKSFICLIGIDSDVNIDMRDFQFESSDSNVDNINGETSNQIDGQISDSIKGGLQETVNGQLTENNNTITNNEVSNNTENNANNSNNSANNTDAVNNEVNNSVNDTEDVNNDVNNEVNNNSANEDGGQNE